MKTTACLATAALLATGAAMANDTGCTKDWCATRAAAATLTSSDGVAVGVRFVGGCHDAYFMVAGNDMITEGSLVVDDRIFTDGRFEAIDEASGLVLSSAALSAIKHGSKAALVTDQGTVGFSLAGSSAALDAAYGYCLAELDRDIPAPMNLRLETR